MPNTPRQAIKQTLKQCIEHVEWVQSYLIQNGEINRADHPDITNQYKIVYSYFQEGKELLETLRATY